MSSKIPEKTCPTCNLSFLPKIKERIYCSQKCANKPKTDYFKERAEKVTFNCLHCDKESTVLKCRYISKNIKYCTRACYKLSKKPKWKIDTICKQFKTTFIPNHKTQFLCTDECHHHYQIGKTKTGFWYENGYRVVYTGNGNGIKEHIHIMETHLGRKLNRKTEVVHHINGVKDDNRLENLQVMTPSDHIRLHRELDILNGIPCFK